MNKYDFSNKKMYDGCYCHEGMKIVPFVIENPEIAVEIGVNPVTMETYHLPNGKKYLLSFTEVPEAEFDIYMQDSYNRQIRDYFDSYGENSYKEKFSRCIINGSVCPVCHRCSSYTKVDSNNNQLRDKNQDLCLLI